MTHPVVVFPDVVAEVAPPLRTLLAGRSEPEVTGVVVHGEVPNPRPTVLVELRRAGGPADTVVTDRARLTVRCWHTTDANAERLTAVVRALIRSMAGTGSIRRVNDVGGPTPAPDTDGTPTYFFSVEITLRGDE
jgi:acetylornithine deacetylase/succinyl-diaminopimelate desuccinylase-like protein